MKQINLENFALQRIVWLLIALFSMHASAQTIQVSGQVTDAATGEPLIGVSVIPDNNPAAGCATDIDGNYTLSVAQGCELVFRSIGYVEQKFKVSGSVLNVALKEDQALLDEVVVVGYGVQKKVNLTGAVGSVSSNELNKRVSSNTTAMLQGRVPGLQIVQNSANPGAESPSIQIRGKGSYGGSTSPLVLIDGVEGNLNNVNPNMIDNITVLKDAASASIYGSRAANGVILVTTLIDRKSVV